MVGLELLKGHEFIGNLTEEEQQLLISNLTKVGYSKGERIVKNGEFVTHAIFVINGFLKIHADFKRKTVILDICGPNSFSGLSFMIGNEKHAFDISSVDDSMVYLINMEIIRKLIGCNGLFARDVIDYMNVKMLHYFEHNFIMLTQSNIHGRLANTIMHLAKNVFFNNNFDLLLSRKELSQLSNISRENVIKVLYEFDAEGLIRLNGQQVHVLNPEQLNHLAKTC
jgi:CRP/FNR family transcriptional regulator, polysaccharide utilization system transcription regulator